MRNHNQLIDIIRKAGGHNDCRRYLNAVYVKDGQYFATNGHLYCLLTLKGDKQNWNELENGVFTIEKGSLGKEVKRLDEGALGWSFDRFKKLYAKPELTELKIPFLNLTYLGLANDICVKLGGNKFNSVKLGCSDEMIVLRQSCSEYDVEIGIMPLNEPVKEESNA